MLFSLPRLYPDALKLGDSPTNLIKSTNVLMASIEDSRCNGCPLQPPITVQSHTQISTATSDPAGSQLSGGPVRQAAGLVLLRV